MIKKIYSRMVTCFIFTVQLVSFNGSFGKLYTKQHSLNVENILIDKKERNRK